ncbi:serine/threonine-protein kinase [Amycolatopsis pittospori]|uniref:serine/threonine-protein kinase n=1 Tax=Amycolatopsis pittospori TaxID=2749434 RepID=UPI0015EFE1BD|nr:serine/threonine-protein kinase [Amycolatopsis pittospori]
MEETRRLADRFDLIEPVGGGSMGTVWRARDDNLERTVAVKELLLPHGQGEEKSDEAKNRALREARIAARLVHPHAITVFGVIDEQDRPWIIMEYLPSTSLADKLREGPMEVDDVIRLAIQLCSALAAAHRAGIVHRDIKPGNVLLGEDDGTVKITDFGISRAMGDVQLTATGEISGTPAFLAPEVARGEDATFASDVFSLGATLYTALEGGTPYGTAENPIALLYRASSGEITPPTRSGILTPLLNRLLDVRPDSRPTMTETERELRALAAGEPTTLVAEEPPPKARKGMLIGVLAGFLVLAAVAAAVVVVLTRGDDGQTGAAPPPASQSQATTPTPSSEPAAPPPSPSSAPPSTPPPSTSSSAPPPPAQTPGQALSAYYALIPGNLQAGFATLTDNFKRTKNQSFERYSNFWKDYRGVAVSNIVESGNTVSATLTYSRAAGGTMTEKATFVMVQQDGRYLIDSQR